MTKIQKKKFVKDLSKCIAQGIINHINAGVIPENWDGHELRQLLADMASHAALGFKRHQPRRYRDFRNTVIINNL